MRFQHHVADHVRPLAVQKHVLDRSRVFQQRTRRGQRTVHPILAAPAHHMHPRPADIEVQHRAGIRILARHAPVLTGPPRHIVRQVVRPTQRRRRDPVPLRRSAARAFHAFQRILDIHRVQLNQVRRRRHRIAPVAPRIKPEILRSQQVDKRPILNLFVQVDGLKLVRYPANHRPQLRAEKPLLVFPAHLSNGNAHHFTVLPRAHDGLKPRNALIRRPI